MFVQLVPLLGIWDSIYGVLSAMMQPLYWAVSGLLVLFHNLWAPVVGSNEGAAWTLAIVSLTVVIRTLLIPLFVKQINSSRNMQMLQPQAQELRKKYGHDRERLGQETMKLYREEGVNPAASCMPILLQMPIFLALFRVLEGASHVNADGTVNMAWVRGHFLKTNPDMVQSLQDARIFGAGLAEKIFPFSSVGPTQVVGLILVVSMCVVLFITQMQLMRKNMPPEALTGPMAQQQKIMLYLFPLIYAMSGAVIPIGVLVYWLTTNLWTMAQQYILIHNNPAPNTPAYIDWEERMRARGKDPVAIAKARREKRQGKSRAAAAPSRVVKGAEAATLDEADDAPVRPTVTRQNVSRQTVVRKDASTGRAQPVRQSRSVRKKK